MDVETKKSLKETLEELINNLSKEKSLKSIESVYIFLQENRKYIFDNKEIPYKLSVRLIASFNNSVISPETVVNIYKIYIDELLTIKNYPDDEIDNLREIITSIFNINSQLYTESDLPSFLLFLKHYFSKYYPKDGNVVHKVGDVMDIISSDEVGLKRIIGWTQLAIKEIDEEKKIYKFEEPKTKTLSIQAKFDDYQIQEKNTFITEEEVNWKKNLKINDMVDVYNANKDVWVEGYIKEINEKGLYIVQPIGESEDIYKNYPFANYSPYIQPLRKFTFNYDPEDKACFTKVNFIEQHNPYRYFVPLTKNNYTMPTTLVKHYSLEFYEVVNYFLNKLVSSNVLMDETISLMFIYLILCVIHYCTPIINMKYFSKYLFENCDKHIKNVLYKYSTSKKKLPNVNQGWKNVIMTIIHYLDGFIAYNDFIFNLFYYQPEFFITFGYNCFKFSDNLEKRHLGLTSILSICPFLKKYYPLMGKKL